jgi:N-acetyl-gamma-glutamyl-phosphate reductase
MIKAGIIGGAGYTGGELIRILLNHQKCNIAFIHSRSQAGSSVAELHTDLIGEIKLVFSNKLDDADVWFLCMGHNESTDFMKNTDIPNDIRIIDLSLDFRLVDPVGYKFIYGLQEAKREKIRSAENIANPGCFATALQLALLPLAQEKLLNNDIHVSGITGSIGAGQKPVEKTYFSWRNSNISVYKAFRHQHLAEISKTLKSMQNNLKPQIKFLPFRGNFTCGILAAVYTRVDISIEEAKILYNNYYESHPFVFISDKNVNVKQVVNSNKSIVYLEKYEDSLMIVNVIDNLIKSASGQAVQNMNLMFGLDETSGLMFKTIAY